MLIGVIYYTEQKNEAKRGRGMGLIELHLNGPSGVAKLENINCFKYRGGGDGLSYRA